MARERPAKPIELPCSFGKVSVGDSKTSVRITIDRSRLKLPLADKTFCGSRLTGKIVCVMKGGSDGPPLMPGANEISELEGVFECSGFGVNPNEIGLTINFSLKDFDLAAFCKFANRDGRIEIQNVEPLEDGDDGEDDEEDE